MLLMMSLFVVTSISKSVKETLFARNPFGPVKLIWTVELLFVFKFAANMREFCAGDKPPVIVWLTTGVCIPEVGSFCQILAWCEVICTVTSFTASPLRSYEFWSEPGVHVTLSQSRTTAWAA